MQISRFFFKSASSAASAKPRHLTTQQANVCVRLCVGGKGSCPLEARGGPRKRRAQGEGVALSEQKLLGGRYSNSIRTI